MRTFIVAIVFVLLLAGCSGSGTGGESSEGTGGEPTLSDFIPGSVAFGDGADAEQQYRQLEREAQDRMAACMADQGFEYVPYVQSQDQGGFAMPETQEEFVAQYGFGIATMMLEDQRMGEVDIEAEMAKDPNNAIVDAMPDTERDAYYEALYGVQLEFEEPGGDSPGVTVAPSADVTVAPTEPTGCQNTAYEETYNQGAQMEFYEQFGPMMEDLYSNLESDPRITELKGQWSSCMAEAGYDFTDEQDAQIFLLRRLEEVGAITDLDIQPDGNGWGYGGSEIEPGSSVEAAVKEIAAEEIAMAKVSLDCSGDIDKVFQEVYQEAEQRFIAENLAELEQFKKDHS